MINIIFFSKVQYMNYRGSCHCGSVEFEIDTDLSVVKQCNCSICKRKYAKMGIASKNDLKIIKGKDNLTMYQFGTNIAKHYFCKICGIYTHHARRSDPNGIGFNLGCLEKVDPFTVDADILDNK